MNNIHIVGVFEHTLTREIVVYGHGNRIDISNINEQLNENMYCNIDEYLQIDFPNASGQYGGDIIAKGNKLIYTQIYSTINKEDSKYLYDFTQEELTCCILSFFDGLEDLEEYFSEDTKFLWNDEGTIESVYTIDEIAIDGVDEEYYDKMVINKIAKRIYNNYIKKKVNMFFIKDISFVISLYLIIS